MHSCGSGAVELSPSCSSSGSASLRLLFLDAASLLIVLDLVGVLLVES